MDFSVQSSQGCRNLGVGPPKFWGWGLGGCKRVMHVLEIGKYSFASRVPTIRGTSLGVPILRILLFGGLY